MLIFKDSENFVGKGLANLINIFKIEDNNLKSINSRQQSLCLRARDKAFVSIPGQRNRDYGFVKAIIVAPSIFIKNGFTFSGRVVGQLHKNSSPFGW